jgi:IclR family transcriptional regulator, acetate operon repressor
VKSATRALEIIELFGVHRHPLSVTEIANALAIPQSSSSVLLHALSSIGFVTRDRKTRKYAPGIRSVFLGNWIHDAIFPGGSLLGALDALSEMRVRMFGSACAAELMFAMSTFHGLRTQPNGFA